MFFDLIILNRQHRATLGVAWIAGTRGIKYVPKNEVLRLDVSRLCDDIESFLNSESDSPRSRFSLRLSAILVNGTLKIQLQKAIYISDECMKFFTNVFKPPMPKQPVMRRAIQDTESFGTPVVRIRTKRLPKPEKETPEDELNFIVGAITAQEFDNAPTGQEKGEEPILQSRLEEITIRETQPQSQELMVVDEQLGDLGVFQPGEGESIEQAVLWAIDQQHSKTCEDMIQPFQGVIQPPSSQTDESPDQRPVTFTVEALVHAPAEPADQRPDTFTAEAVAHAPAEPQPLPPRHVLGEMPISVVEERDREIVMAQKMKKGGIEDYMSKLFISTAKPKPARIDRCKMGDPELVDINLCPLPKFRLKNPDYTSLLQQYMVREPTDLVKNRKVSGGSSLQDSNTIQRKSQQLTPVEERAIPRIVEPLPPPVKKSLQMIPEIDPMLLIPPEMPQMVSTPIVRREMESEDLEIQRTREDIVAEAAERPMISLMKKRKLLDGESEFLKELDIAIDLPSCEQVPSSYIVPEEATLEGVSVPTAVITERVRQQTIVNIISQGSRERYTLEEIAQKPLNKLNVARAFSDLLVLGKHNYVKLISEESSTELAFIEKGPKLTK